MSAANQARVTEFNARTIRQRYPQLGHALDEVAQVVQLELLQGIASVHDPKEFPVVAASTTIAGVAQQWARSLPAVRRALITRKAAKEMPAHLAAVASKHHLNVRSATPIHLQLVRPTQNKPGAEVVLAQLEQFAATLSPPQPRPRARFGKHAGEEREEAVPRAIDPGGKIEKVIFRMNQLLCIEDTTEKGKDEISLTGFASDDEGHVLAIAPLDLGKLKAGDFKNFNPPKPLATFDNNLLNNDFPHTYNAALVLSEEEFPRVDNIRDLLYKLYAVMLLGGFGLEIGALVVLIVAGVAGIAVSAGALLVVALIGAALAMLGLLVGYISTLAVFNPEIFPEQIGAITLPTVDGNFDGQTISPPFTLDFEAFGGHYQLVYTWELVKGAV